MRTAVVVGAGIGGLAAAGALARTGWQVTLLERADRLRAGRAALLLWPNGVRALRALGLGAGLDAIAHPGARRPASAARTGGGCVQPRPGRGRAGAPVVVHRDDLHDALIAGLGDQSRSAPASTVRRRARRRRRAPGGQRRPAHLRGRPHRRRRRRRQRDPRAGWRPSPAVVSAGYAAWRAVIPWYRAPRAARRPAAGGETLGAGHRFVAASLGERGSSGGSAAAASTGSPPPPARPGRSRRRPS